MFSKSRFVPAPGYWCAINGLGGWRCALGWYGADACSTVLARPRHPGERCRLRRLQFNRGLDADLHRNRGININIGVRCMYRYDKRITD
jgi:hypothetical protein